jgi:bacterial leucyl aminopeptidase
MYHLIHIYIDSKVTDHWRVAENEPVISAPLPTKLQHQKSLHKITDQVNVSSIEENLLRLTSFHTRFYRSSSGAAASKWIQSMVESYASTASKEWNIKVTPFPHSWIQNSIIIRLEDRNATQKVNSKDNGVMILGAHLDSVNWLNPLFGRSPGADDDGSGTYLPLHSQ